MRTKNLKFPIHIAFIYRWIQSDYDNANTDEELHNLFWKWIEEANDTQNKVRSICFKKSAYALYQELTGRSLESVENNINNLVRQC